MEQEEILNLLRTWVLEKDPGIIAISDFERDAIEARCEALADNRGTGFKIQSDKEHDEPPIWDDYIFKFDIVIKKLYA